MKVVYTKSNPASFNIAKRIMEIDSEFELTEFQGDVLEVPNDFETDCIVVLSTHKSKKPSEMLTIHVPGNWNSADFGGEKRTLNIADAVLMKRILRKMDEWNKKLELNWPLYIEADHHGPTGEVPIIFVEIGCNEKEWNNKMAGRVIANAILESVKEREEFETVLCVGEGHYAKKFTKIALESGYAVGHILPKYGIKELEQDTFEQAINKNTGGKISLVLIDKECNRWQKDKIEKLCKENKIKIKEV